MAEPKSSLSTGTLRGMLSAVLLLAGIFHASIVHAEDDPPLDCDNPVTQSDMNQCAYLDFDKADQELNAVWEKAKAYMVKQDEELKAIDPELVGGVAALMKAQRAWIDYRDGQCEAYGFQSRGGTMEPMLVSGCKAQLTRARTKELKELYEAN